MGWDGSRESDKGRDGSSERETEMAGSTEGDTSREDSSEVNLVLSAVVELSAAIYTIKILFLVLKM